MRLIGQSVSAIVTSNPGGLETGLNDVSACEIQMDMETMSEGFLGQNTERKDAIFTGVSGNIEFQSGSAAVMSLIERIKVKQQARTAGGIVFNVIGTFRFSDGTRRVIIPDVAFGALPITVSSRKDYVKFKVDFTADDCSFLAA